MAATNFDENQVRKLFRTIDKSGRGGITAPELILVMKRIGEDVSESEGRAIVSQADTKGTGMITEDDFIQYMMSRSSDFTQMLREVFESMDTKNVGFLTPSQLRAGFKKVGMKLSEAELKDIMSVVDSGKTGQISWEEFLKVTQ